MNTLYDLPGEVLRVRQQLLRLRKYGSEWTLTHKAKKKTGRHSSREELQTNVEDGKKMDLILRALGYAPSFRYEKYRAEWTDGKGHVVVDETPDWKLLRDRRTSALDRRDGEKAWSNPGRLHHEELRWIILGMEGSNKKPS